jgi:hypothetical protein
MKRILFLLPLLVAMFFLGACESEAPLLAPPVVEETPGLQVSFGLSNTEDYIPFDSTTIPMVSGGSRDCDFELFLDGQSLGNDPIQIIRFEEVRVYEIKLRVTDRETGEVKEALASASGLELPEGASLENWLVVPRPIVRVGDDVFVSGGARGGSDRYEHVMLLNGESVGQVAIMPVTIHELGDNELVLKTTDIETGEVILSQPFMVVGLDPEPTPELQMTMVLAPKRVQVNNPVFISMAAMSGTPPYGGFIKVDGQVISGDFVAVFTPTEIRGYHVECHIYDSGGESLVIEEMIDPYEPDAAYVHPTTVTISGPHEQQAGEDFQQNADVDGDPGYSLRWYKEGQSEPFAWGEDITVSFDNPGFQEIKVEVYYDDVFACDKTRRLTVTPADAFDDSRVDVSMTPAEFQLGDSATGHADVHNLIGEYALEWYEVYTGGFLGYGNDITYTPAAQGEHEIECRVIMSDLMRVNGYGSVTVTPPDSPVGPSVNLGSDNYRDYAPFCFTLDADTTPGDAPIVDINWYEVIGGQRRPLTDYWGDLFHGIKGSLDDQLFEVEVIDANGLVATDSLWERALAHGESWSEIKDLKVGPSQAVDTGSLSHTPDYPQRYYISFLMKFDVNNADRADVVVELKYPDGSSWYLTVPDLNPERPSELIVRAGEVLIEAGMEIKLHYLGAIYPDKCDGWDRISRVYGDANSNKSTPSEGVLVVTGSSQRPDGLSR